LKNESNKQPFFILGRERSGTTMLRVSLNNHPNISIPPESPFIIHLYKKYYGNKNIKIDEFLIDLKKEPFLHVWNIDYEELSKKLYKTSPPTFSNYCKTVLNNYQQKDGVLGDKNPTNSLFGRQLNKVFPDAKFIWIIRDYRAQVNSMLKVNFEKKIISSLAKRWVSYNKEIEFLQKNYPKQILLVKYEELVESPEKSYKDICMFLEVAFEHSVLSTSKSKKEFHPKHHKSLEEEINTKHVEEWKNQLTKKQIEICEAIAGNYGAKFGYRKTLNYNPFTIISVLFGITYGRLYILFIKIMYALPLDFRVFINHKIIYKNATFWKEAKEYYME
jgi:hypothetical protein